MASGSSSYLSLFLFLLHLLISCSSGNAADCSTVALRIFPTDGSVHSLPAGSGLSVYLLLNESQVKNLISSEPSTVSWLKARLLHEKDIRSIIVRIRHDRSRLGELQNLQLTLKAVDRIAASFGSKHGVKLAVAFAFPFLEKLAIENSRELLKGIEKSVSTIIIEAGVSDDQDKGEWLLRYIIERGTLVSSRLPIEGLNAVLSIKGPAAPVEISQLRHKISEIFNDKKTEIDGKLVEIVYVEEPISIPSRRELLNSYHLKSTVHDTVFPITPMPAIVTVPGTPTNPTLTPLVFPSPNSITYPTPQVPVPMTPVPVTNPATTYTSPPSIPVITPVTVPTTNPPAIPSASPAIPGQSWCVAMAGATETALQAALDYACGIGGADCSQIQMGASCYNPNTIQSHASYAFNSYYQRNPAATSCDFGGTATIVATNPSTGSCIYTTYSQTSVPPTTTTTTPTPTPTTASFSPPSIGAVPVPELGSGTPPAVLNTGNPASGNPTDFGLAGPPPPAPTTLASSSARLKPYIGCSILLICLVVQDLCYRGRARFSGYLHIRSQPKF